MTLGLAAAGRFPWKGTPAYIIAQVIGGLVATTLIYLIGLNGPDGWLTAAADGGFASNGWDKLSPGGFGIGGAIIVEVLFTALFVIVILAVTHSTRGNPAFAGLVIGLTLTLIHLATIPIDNTSVNPARSIATAVYGGGLALVPAVGVHRVPDRRRPDRGLRLPRAVRRHEEGLTARTRRARPRGRALLRAP